MHLRTMFAGGASFLVASASAYAGSGTFDTGSFNFCVSLRFNATQPQISQVQTAFQNGSQILADATDGQHRFGEVIIANNSGASRTAEYWVFGPPRPTPGRRAIATEGLYGRPGQHVNLYFPENFAADLGADGDAYTIAHEHAHHAYDVLDEYSGPNRPCINPPTDCAGTAPIPINTTNGRPDYSLDATNLNFSLMDFYFLRGGRRGISSLTLPYTLNEFEVAQNVDTAEEIVDFMDTFQFANRNRMPAWNTIANSRFPATAPAGLPLDAAPAAHTVTFIPGFSGLRIMLLLDRSGSMAVEHRLEFAQAGARQFVNLVSDGTAMGLASFADTPSPDFPLTTLSASADDRTNLNNAINGLRAFGNTNIGGGLLTALAEISGQTTISCDEFIILLSDGDHNEGTPPNAAIPSLKAEGVTVFSIGVGTSISTEGETTLRNVASETGGEFLRAANSRDIGERFLQLLGQTANMGIVARAPLVAAGQGPPVADGVVASESDGLTVLIEENTATAIFAIALPQDAAVTTSLVTPGGEIIGPEVADGDIAFFDEGLTQSFHVQMPEPGEWRLLVDHQGTFDLTVQAIVLAEHDGVDLSVAPMDDTPSFPDATNIRAVPRFEGIPVVGATVEGVVIRPDGSEIEVVFRDDGQGGDGVPDDGTYGALFDQYSGNGTYTFEIRMINQNGRTAAGESLFAVLGTSASTATVAPFTREASATVVVTNVPDDLDTDRDGIPNSQDQCISSDLRRTVVIGGADTGVSNVQTNTLGCTIMDLLEGASDDAMDRTRFIRAVALITRTLIRDGLIINQDAGAIRTAASQAAFPLP